MILIKSDSEFITIRNSKEFNRKELSGYKEMEHLKVHTKEVKIKDINPISQSQVIERTLKNKNIAGCKICFE